VGAPLRVPLGHEEEVGRSPRFTRVGRPSGPPLRVLPRVVGLRASGGLSLVAFGEGSGGIPLWRDLQSGLRGNRDLYCQDMLLAPCGILRTVASPRPLSRPPLSTGGEGKCLTDNEELGKKKSAVQLLYVGAPTQVFDSCNCTLSGCTLEGVAEARAHRFGLLGCKATPGCSEGDTSPYQAIQ